MKISGKTTLFKCIIVIFALLIFAPCGNSNPFEEINALFEKENLKSEGESRIYRGDELYELIDGGADIYFEYGFVAVMTKKISYNDCVFNISIYQMKSPESAFGILTFSQHEEMKKVEDIPNGRISTGKLIFSKGNYFFIIQSESFDSSCQKELIYIGKVIDKIDLNDEEKIVFDKILPVENRIQFSEKYIVGQIGTRSAVYLGDEDVLELSNKRPGYFARYDFSGKKIFLLLVPLNSKACHEIKGKVERIFKGKYEKLDDIDGIACYADKRGRLYSISCSDEKLILIYRAEDKEVIKKVISSIKLQKTK